MRLIEVQSIFALAGIEALKFKALIDGYSYAPSDERFFHTYPRCVWWFVKTKAGWIEIGCRKRVIAINWEDTPVRKIVTEDDVTKDSVSVHAWSPEDAIKYLRALKPDLESAAKLESK